MKHNTEKDSNIEKCVICKTETEELIHTHIDYRSYYVEGAGQLCKDCYEKIYNKSKV
jgi:hypothetical protein